ncbi:hypothetical protein CROQUDRAFT_101025 [Cronartium quercuum f. sp. fusiforme G11]|uniref:Uncharacterized protein n=1 Tax=Cronartium quercuum f. sp. fusiforme G11 TaxID=708437 RepID=A0A9P6T5F2_9BASI|nr:hypothetical protein CROQUDRAFT_101025 [Cronartium quercuum f. sp. fusiforme G11]
MLGTERRVRRGWTSAKAGPVASQSSVHVKPGHAYNQLDTHPAIKIAIQPMMDKLHLYRDATLRKPVYLCAVMLGPRRKMDNICPNLITKTEAHNLLSSECKRLCGDNPFQLHHPDQPGSEGTSESDPWALTGAAMDPFQ